MLVFKPAPGPPPDGQVLSTSCIIDDQSRTITDQQKKALQLLAKKAMSYLKMYKLVIEEPQTINLNAAHLRKLSDQALGGQSVSLR